MKIKYQVRGLAEAQAELNRALAGIGGNTENGINMAGEFVKGESQELTPVDEGVLANSAFVRRIGNKVAPAVEVGYTAKYAAAVHEAPMTLKGQPRANFGKTGAGESFGGGSGKGNYWDGGENKFLEKAVVRNITAIYNIIKKFAEKKPL